MLAWEEIEASLKKKRASLALKRAMDIVLSDRKSVV